jgi:hypothetical protein
MSRTKAQKQGAPRIIWGSKAIGEVIGRTKKQTDYLLEQRRIPARKIGKLWAANYDLLIEIGNPDKAA